MQPSDPKNQSDETQNRPPETRRPSPLIFMTAGMEFTGVCAGMSLAGWWIDGNFETKPWFMVIGLAMGLIGGTYKLYNQGKQFFK